MIPGNQGCRCTNETATLSSLTERSCEVESSGESGIRLTLGGLCVPNSFGSSRCLQHDLHHDPACISDGDDNIIPAYCLRPWCYVDAHVCARESNERVYRSSYFNFDTGVDMFYSYSTCNSTADDWLEVESEKVPYSALGQITIQANIPTFDFPMMYKKDPISKERLNMTGSEYYNNSIPYEGIYPTFVESIAKISMGDIKNITYTYRSKVSSDLHPRSKYTAAIQDVQDGLVDMSVGPFWITSERLLMSAFTIPIVSDKVFLVVPKPGSNNESPLHNVSKVTEPFTPELWGLMIGIIIVTGLLSVWFSDRSKLPLGEGRSSTPLRRRKRAYLRLAIDSILEKGMFFCSAGVEQDAAATLPKKLLMFGFGFFILIAVSAYVANLAAFLTRSSLEGSVTTIDGAIARGWTICAHSVFRNKLPLAWPTAKFLFKHSNHHRMLEDYKAGKCEALAIGWEDTSMDPSFLDKICETQLVYTESIFFETPMGFPIRQALAAGFSHWILEAKGKNGIDIQTAKNEYTRKSMLTGSSCNVQFSVEDIESSDYDPITIGHMLLPIMVFIACCILAIIGHLCSRKNKKKRMNSFFGRPSQLNLTTDEPSHIDRARRMGERMLGSNNYNSKKDDGDAAEMPSNIHTL